MKRFLYCLMTLLVLGLTTLPCAATDYTKDAEERVSKMTEAEMRAALPGLKKEQATAKQLLMKSKGSSDKLAGIDQALSQGVYDFNTAMIKAIERRLKVIDSQRMKEEQERQKKEMEELEKKKQTALQQQQELEREIEEAQRKQKELQEAVERNKAEREKMYKNLSKFVQTSNKAVIEGNEALELTGSDYHPNFESMPQDLDMSLRGDQQQDASDEPSDIAGLFGGKRTKSEQTEGDEEELSDEDIENQKAALQEQEEALQQSNADLEKLNEELKKKEAQLLEQQAKLLQILESINANKQQQQSQPSNYELADDDEPSDNNNKSDNTKKTNKGKKNKNNRK